MIHYDLQINLSHVWLPVYDRHASVVMCFGYFSKLKKQISDSVLIRLSAWCVFFFILLLRERIFAKPRHLPHTWFDICNCLKNANAYQQTFVWMVFETYFKAGQKRQLNKVHEIALRKVLRVNVRTVDQRKF